MGKTIVLGLLTCSMFFNVGCDSSDVAAGAVGVGVGIGVGRHYERERERERERDRWERDRWGRGGWDDNRGGWSRGDGWDRGDRWGRGSDGGYRRCGPVGCFSEDLGTVNANAIDMESTSNLAQKYGISNKAGAKIEAAFANVKTQGIASFESIGLDKSALKQLAQKQVPSEDALKSMATKLDMSEAQSRDMVQAMIAEFNAQSSDVNSPYWQSCMAKGTWKTGSNTKCSDVSWKGCSPQTGANLCY